VVLDDHRGTFHGVYTLTYHSVQRDGFVGLTYKPGQVRSLTLDGANTGPDYDVMSTSCPITLNSGGDNSTFIIGGNGNLDIFAGLVTVNGKGANNRVGLDDDGSAFQGTYTVTSTSVSRPDFAGLTYNGMQSLDLTGSKQGDVFDVLSTSVFTILYGIGSSSMFNVGEGDLGALAGQVAVHGFTGSAGVIVDDHQASGGTAYTITSGSLTRRGFGGLTFDGVQSLVVDGAGSGDVYNVQNTSFSTTLNGGGADTFNIGNGNLANVQDLTVNGSGSGNTVVLDDHLANYLGAYTVGGDSASRGGFHVSYNDVQDLTLIGAAGAGLYNVLGPALATTLVVGAGNLGSLPGGVAVNGLPTNVVLDDHLAPFQGVYSLTSLWLTRPGFGGVTGSSLQRLTLDGASGREVYNVTGTLVPTILNGDGNDTFNIGPGDLASVGSVTINGRGSKESVILDDRFARFRGAYTITSSSVTRAGFGGLTYSNVQSLELDGSSTGDVYNVLSTSAATILNSGGGNDSFNIGNGELDDMRGNLTVLGNGGTDPVVLDDHLSNALSTSFTITSNMVTRKALTALLDTEVFSLTYHGVRSLTLNGIRVPGNRNNTYTVESTSIPTTIDNGTSSDVFYIGNGNLDHLASPLTIRGSGNSELYVQDTQTHAKHTYTVTPSMITRTGAAVIDYTGAVILQAGNEGNTINVRGNLVAVQVEPGAAGDHINFSSTSHTLDALGGVAVDDKYGASSVNVDDSGFSGSDTFTSTVIPAGHSTLGSITVGRLSNFVLVYRGIGNLNLAGGSGGTQFQIDATAANTTLYGGAGNNVFNIGDGDLGALQGKVTVNGKGATNAVVLDDHLASFAGTYTITSNSVTRPGFGGLTYNDVQSLTLDGAGGGDSYDISSTSAPTTINPGSKLDTFNVIDLNNLVVVNGSLPFGAPQVTWAPAPLTAGTALSSAQLDATSSIAGTFTYTPAAGTLLGAGKHVLSAIFVPAGHVKVAPVTVFVPLLVNPVAASKAH
jgi:acrosin